MYPYNLTSVTHYNVDYILEQFFNNNMQLYNVFEKLKNSCALGKHMRVNYTSDTESFSLVHSFKNPYLFANNHNDVREVLFMYKNKKDGVIKPHKQLALKLQDHNFDKERVLFLVNGVEIDGESYSGMLCIAKYQMGTFLCDLTNNPKIEIYLTDTMHRVGREPFLYRGKSKIFIENKTCYDCKYSVVDYDYGSNPRCTIGHIIYDTRYLCADDYEEEK